MPELVHRENAPLAETPEHMADLVAEAGTDLDLRRRVGRRGLQTLITRFRTVNVVTEIADRLRQLVCRPGNICKKPLNLGQD